MTTPAPRTKSTKTSQISVRVEAEITERADALALIMPTLWPELRAITLSRAAVLRLCMLRGLDVLNDEARSAEKHAPAATRKRAPRVAP